MIGLIGYTGVVGKTIVENRECYFDHLYNTSNIDTIDGEHFEELYISAIPGDKWFANSHPEEDLNNIKSLFKHLENVTADKVLFISSIDVVQWKDEPYAINRSYAEEEIKRLFNDVYILRLPALVGKNIKKNFIYDIKNLVPRFFASVSDHRLLDYYTYDGRVYKLKNESHELLELLKELNLTALSFTNKDSKFEFFDLDNIWKYIAFAFFHKQHELTITADPLSAYEVCASLGLDTGLLSSSQKKIVYDYISDIRLSKEEQLEIIRKYLSL